MKKSSKVAGVLAVLGLLVSCLYGSIEFHAFHANYYKSEYQKLNTAESIGMSNEALFEATDALLDYLKGKRSDISCIQEVNGTRREVFDQREKDHMVDVLALYQNASKVCLTFIGVGLLSLGYLFYLVKSKKRELSCVLWDVKDGFRQVVSAFLIVALGLVVYALVDFSRFWTTFHEIFFNNDLWLLDPRISIMINMFPEEFFFGMVMRIALTFIGTFCGTSMLYYYLVKKQQRKTNESV